MLYPNQESKIMEAVTQRFGKRRTILVLVLVVALFGALFTAVAPVNASKAEAATVATYARYHGVVMPSGTGRPYGGWVGTFKGSIGGATDIGPCIVPNANMANATSIAAYTSTLPGFTAENSNRAKYLANKYGSTTSNTVAKRLAIAVWRLLNNTTYTTYQNQMKSRGYLSSADVTAINNMLNESKNHGPWKATVTGVKAPVGGNAVVKATIKASNGHTAPSGFPVSWSVANCTIISKSTVTNSSGQVGITCRRTSAKLPTVRFTVTAPSSHTVLINHRTSSRVQYVIGGNRHDTVSSSWTYTDTVPAPSYSSTCSTNCDGNSTVTVTVTNTATNAPLKEAIYNGSTLLGYTDVAAGQTGQATYTVMDGSHLGNQSCFTNILGGSCATAWVKGSTTYEVVCPAWAQAEITVGCNCSNSWAHVTFTAPAGSPRYYTGRTTLQAADGTVLGTMPTVNVPTGQSVTQNITMQVAAGIIIVADFSVYRDAALTQPLVQHQVLVKVQVLSVANTTSGAKVTYSKTVTEDGKVVSSTTKTATVTK